MPDPNNPDMPEMVKSETSETSAADEAEIKRRLEELSSRANDAAAAEAEIKAAMTANEDEGVNEDEVGVVDGDIDALSKSEPDSPEIEKTEFTFPCPLCHNKITIADSAWVGATKCGLCGYIIESR
jgi:hypothetical protein